MNKEKIRKILIIISIIIIGFGIVSGISVSNELTSGLKDADSSAFMIDGSDFSGFAKAFLGIGASIIGFVVVLFTVAIVLVIWAVYGIILLIIKIVNKIKEKKNENL